VSPLRIKLDGDTSAIPATPDSLTDPATLVVDDRVRTELSGNRLVVLGRVGGTSLLPSGSMVEFAGATQPSQWLFCNGQSLVRADYPTLFAAIGVVYGAADSTHFNVPDKRGRVSVGLDSTQTEFDALGEKGGAKTHTLTVDEMPSHEHELQADSNSGNTAESSGGHRLKANGADLGRLSSSYSNPIDLRVLTHTGGSAAHNNMQPYIALNHIIKI